MKNEKNLVYAEDVKDLINGLESLPWEEEVDYLVNHLPSANDLLVEEIIATIQGELDQSTSSRYICKDGTVITTDVGYVEDWFREYADVLRKRYCTKR